MKDTLKQYVALRSGLIAEKAALEARLKEINKALDGVASKGSPAKGSEATRGGRPPSEPKALKPGRRTRKRARNEASLKDAAVAVLAGGKSLSRKDLLQAVTDSGYKFTAKDPLNSLSALIYSAKKVFKAKDGMISLA